MISKKAVNTISILIITGYIFLVLFGKYLANPLWDLLYKTDPPTIDLKTHLIFAISPLLSLLIPISYAILLYSFSKSLQTIPLIWTALGLVKGPLAIVLFVLIILYQNRELDIAYLKSKFNQIMIWFLVLLLIGIIIKLLKNASVPILSRFLTVEQFGHYSMLSRIESILVLIYIAMINIAIAVWIYNESQRRKELTFLWVILALVSGLLTPIFFIIYNLIKFKFENNTATNQVNKSKPYKRFLTK